TVTPTTVTPTTVTPTTVTPTTVTPTTVTPTTVTPVMAARCDYGFLLIVLLGKACLNGLPKRRDCPCTWMKSRPVR
ncbi:MAG: hypothetical protein CMJ70_05020, partial [Planctomycetaceae bacterium]|nr:hypothetical protein [Planctomycetaceae bacterium]